MAKATHNEPHITLIEQPESLKNDLAVIMGRHVVYLPGLFSIDLYDNLASENSISREGDLSGRLEVPWPTKPRYELDFMSAKS